MTAPSPARSATALPIRRLAFVALLAIAPEALAQTSPHADQAPAQEVVFRGGQLSVHASNSSLNDLLRQISNATGMRISGHIADDRVFGNYGPGDPQTIIATLLEGTRTNILILSNTIDCPLQLLLTPRTGSATPPSELAAERSSDQDADPPPFTQPGPGSFRQQQRSIPINQPQNPSTGAPGNPGFGSPATDPAATQPSSTTQQVVFPSIGDGSAPSTATTTPTDGTNSTETNNAPKTPEQIFNQLQKMHQHTPNSTSPADGSASPQ